MPIKIISISAIVAILAVAAKMSYYNRLIAKRFPDLDPKVARKAYRVMLKKSATGQYPPLEDFDDDDMDLIFLNEYRILTEK